jgi:hypothetical protein
MAHRQLDAEISAQIYAERRVRRRIGAQAVVDVQRAHVAARSHGEIEQADRVAAAREQHQHRRAEYEQPAGPDARLDGHGCSGEVARNSSVGSSKPFIRTSPICRNARWRPAASTTGRVTRTSPPAARALTRDARLTARP